MAGDYGYSSASNSLCKDAELVLWKENPGKQVAPRFFFGGLGRFRAAVAEEKVFSKPLFGVKSCQLVGLATCKVVSVKACLQQAQK